MPMFDTMASTADSAVDYTPSYPTIPLSKNKERIIDPSLYDEKLIFDLQKGYIPQAVLTTLLSDSLILDIYIRGWQTYLKGLSRKPEWRLTGLSSDEDFIQSMLMGYIPSKEVTHNLGGIWKAAESYDPSRKGQRPTSCPECGSSFWSHEHGNTHPAFAQWGISEYKTEKADCQSPITINKKKFCAKVKSTHSSEQEANRAKGANNLVIQSSETTWQVICGYVTDLMSFSNYVHKFIMRPVKTEHRRHLTAPTKGRIHTVEAFTCISCGRSNTLNDCHSQSDSEESDSLQWYECTHCGKMNKSDEIRCYTIEKNNTSLSTPLGFDGKATFGDLLPSPMIVDEELKDVENAIHKVRETFMDILRKISSENEKIASQRKKDRVITKIPRLERSLRKAKAMKNIVQIEKLTAQLNNEKESLLKDENRIESSQNLIEMFKLHYIGDDEGEKWDLKRLTEKFMFKSLPYTQCLKCNHRMYELNETGKIEAAYVTSRHILLRKARLGIIEDYRTEDILKFEKNPSDLLPHLGSFFWCAECNSIELQYFAKGTINPAEPRIEITPHIFQPAQREIRDLESQVFSYYLQCPQCSHNNSVRPDKMTGEIDEYKTSKRIAIEEDGTRTAVRSLEKHTCAKCQCILTRDDVVRASKAKDAFSLLQQLSELVTERNKLKTLRQSRYSCDFHSGELESA